jgi:hypothetical protein
MLILLSIWLAVGIGLVVCQARRGGAGLPLAYFLGASLIHVPGALLYLDAAEGNVTEVGFEQTILGMVAFLVGIIIAVFVRLPGRRASAGQTEDFNPQRIKGLDRLALIYLIVGSIVSFALLPLAARIPSATAVVAPLGSLIVVGACVGLWVAKETRNSLKFWLIMGLLPLLPVVTLIQGGFLGAGTSWAMVIISFLFAQSKRKLVYLLLAPAVFYGGLSVFVNYMAAREEFRNLVWHQQASIDDRLSRVADSFLDFVWLDLSNSRHRKAIDDRLNQNAFIGVAVERLEMGAVEFASGETLAKAAIGLIPRVFWPDKPPVGGGGSLVHDFTGIEFADGSSFGAGQTFEFYVNFGSLGVIGGFLLYGWLIGRVDLSVIKYLRQGDQRRFLLWFLPGLTLLGASGGNFLELAVGTLSSIITGYCIGYFLPRCWGDRKMPFQDYRRGHMNSRLRLRAIEGP